MEDHIKALEEAMLKPASCEESLKLILSCGADPATLKLFAGSDTFLKTLVGLLEQK